MAAVTGGVAQLLVARLLMHLRAFSVLTALSGINLIVFGMCRASAAEDHGASLAGLIPALIVYICVFVSFILTVVAWSALFREIRRKCISW